jgi:hypothetical protein
VRERLLDIQQAVLMLYVERLRSEEAKQGQTGDSISLKSQTGLQLRRTQMIARTKIVFGKVSKKISQSELNRV